MGTSGFEDNDSDYHKLQDYANTTKRVVADGRISTPNIVGFLSKMEKFFFSPPSDNLWSVHIEVDDTNNKSLSKLY